MNRIMEFLPKHIAPRGLPPVAETLPAAIEKLICEVDPEKIILFGSYAYGDPTPDSDVDLLVVVRADGSYRERYMRVAMALQPRLFPLDLIVKTPEEVEEALQTFSPFLREAYTKGICLYERERSSGLGSES
ncbi:MAG: nucleotidyltransferase domain-containing protein [Anaerolineae bacterium]|jgi:predicted nucleotidyltransferase|nr:nucleotidyltransferase domain-containing protein [Anaerolineae bacterium]MDH7474878.1 nucleotidyltransferase domain-containing protein [Anaerolineae bacterium]